MYHLHVEYFAVLVAAAYAECAEDHGGNDEQRIGECMVAFVGLKFHVRV
jgi:hypothetical protein